MCAVFYPKDAKEALKRGVGAIAKGAGGQDQEQREHPGRSTEKPPAGAASSWSPDATQGTANE
jgi:hypothetical protein